MAWGRVASALENGTFFVGSTNNVAAAVSIIGDVTISNSGVATIGAGKVTSAMLVPALTGKTYNGLTLATTIAGFTIGAGKTLTVTQEASANQKAVTQTQTSLTDATTGTATPSLAVILAGAAYKATDMLNTKNNFAAIGAQLGSVKTDVANLSTLVHALRTALINSGLIKGGL